MKMYYSMHQMFVKKNHSTRKAELRAANFNVRKIQENQN